MKSGTDRTPPSESPERPPAARGPHHRLHLLAGLGVAAAMLVSIAAVAYVELFAPPAGALVVHAAVPPRPPADGDRGAYPPPLARVYLDNDAVALEEYFANLDYTLRRVRRGGTSVPRVYAASMPEGLAELQPVERRKSLFIRILLPLVLRENERLRFHHDLLRDVRRRREAGEALEPELEAWLAEQSGAYGVEPGDLELLLRRVDAVPPSLAIAQAATESAWGTSRFVREGNALFGQWTWKAEQKGIVPRERSQGARHRIRAFDHLRASVRAYMHTLNTHWAYEDFRLRRAHQRQRRDGHWLDGLALAGEMILYSEKRALYIASLRSLIRVNRLQGLDDADLAGGRFAARRGRTAGSTSLPAALLGAAQGRSRGARAR